MSTPTGSPTKWKAQQRRVRGRLGIDIAAASPSAVVLPPLASQGTPRRSPSRHVRLARQQEEERSSLRLALRQRVETTRALVDLVPLKHIVERSLRDVADAALRRADVESAAGDSCFSNARRVVSHLADAPFLSHFLLDLVSHVERLVHAKRLQESIAAQHSRPIQAGAVGDEAEEGSSSSASESDHEHNRDDGDRSSDDIDESPEQNHERSSGDASSVGSATNQHVGAHDLRHARATDAVFRTTLRSRTFPSTRVPTSEYIQKTSSHLPFDQLKRSVDLASLRLRGHDEYGSAQWSVVVFPKSKPSLTSQEELEAFAQWAERKQTQLVASFLSEESDVCSGPNCAFETACLHFKATLALKEHTCFELSRFIFDKCPTTARFLHRLFVELVEVAVLTLSNSEREYQIMEQRHKNVQLELSRLNDKLTKVQASLASVEDTLLKRQHMLLRERELIIRKRKKLNLLLGADQVLIRRIVGLVNSAQEIGDDILQSAKTMAAGSLPADGNASEGMQVNADVDADGHFPVLDEIVAIVVNKYQDLPQVRRARQKATSTRGVSQDSTTSRQALNGHASPGSRDLIVLDASSVQTALDEYKATLLRLCRMMSAKSPDSSIGWDGQELWDQALFIPPHEDVQDLERDVQRLSLLVEERILLRRQQRARGDAVRTASVQTDISACTTKAGNQNQRWRARPFAPHTVNQSTSLPVVRTWNWRQLARARRSPETASEPRQSARKHEPVCKETELPSTREDDHRDLLKTLVPDGFRAFIRTVPPDYVPQQLDLVQVHNVISYLFNGVWMLVQEDFHRPPRFSTNSTARASDDARLIPLTPFHEYIYRIFLQHFHIESVVTSRILDLLLSASRLDTQSCKVQLFCRLLGLPGVATFPSDGFWFVLKSLHVLQRCCGSSGGYFLLDGEGDNEFVPQASAAEAIGQLFSGSSNDVMKRLRVKLAALTSVYGTVWIPAYNVLTFIMDEWKHRQDDLQVIVEEKLFLEHASEMDPFTGNRIFTKEGNVVSFSEFLQGFHILKLNVSRWEAVQAYRQLLVDSATPSSSSSTTSSSPAIDRHRFYVNWMQMILHAVNVSQQQMLRSANSIGTQATHAIGSSGGAPGPGVQLGAISDAMLAANQNLSYKFLVATWEQMKPDIIRRLDTRFHDVGLQVRLVQQMDMAIEKQQHLPQQQRDGNSAWRSFHHLIQIAYSTTTAVWTPT